MSRASVWMTAAVIAWAITGCSDDISSGTVAQPDSVTVAPATATLAVGETQIVTATFKVGGAAEPDAVGVWASSDPSVVAVNSLGVSCAIIGIGGGTADVTVSDGPVSATVHVTVPAATATRLDVSPTQVAVPLGGIVPIHVGAVFPGGVETEVTDQVTWTTDAAAIATVTGSQV